MTTQNETYALITGATSGIGYELAKVFAEHDYNLIIVARTANRLNDVAEELSLEYGVDVIPIAKDLFDAQSPFDLYEEVKAKGLQVDVLVNDAGQGLYGRFIDTDIYRELDIIQLNINAYVVLTKLFLQDMVNNQYGKILNVASIAGKVPGPFQSVYHGTKAFVHSFTEAVRAELADTGVTITSLLPGATDTDFFHKADMENSKILDHELADPAKVAADGFKALMSGDDMVVSGFKNKAQVAMSNVTPDSTVAKAMLKQQEPRDTH
ncbi:MAG: SDR family oxidoreductase [Gammaproteobacteria bacterium]|nr:MAG: SDR family oxidoreductase [Gammaproteobacteria bacterium]